MLKIDGQEQLASPSSPKRNTIQPSSCDEKVAIIWFHQGPLGSHAGILIDDVPYGFEPIGFKSTSPSTMKKAANRVLSGKGHAEGITLLWLKVTAAQKREIKKQCEKSFVPGYSCMNIVSRIIPEKVVKIPTELSVSSDVSLLYLRHMKEYGHENLLDFEHIDGPNYEVSKFQKNENVELQKSRVFEFQDRELSKILESRVSKFREIVQERYSTNGMILTSLVVSLICTIIFSTLVSCVDHERGKKSIFIAAPLFIVTILRIKQLMVTSKIPRNPHLS